MAGLSTDTMLVSCLMVTRLSPDRLDYAKRSLEAYLRQSHPLKELLVVLDGRAPEDARIAFARHVAELGRPDVRILARLGAGSLGAKRNLSLDHARGDVVCQWDDDDLSHPERLRRQLALLLEGDQEAVYLQEVMQFFPASSVLYWTNWRATEAKGHPGTLMMRRGLPVRYVEDGPTANLGEDLDLARQLQARGKVAYLAGAAELFIYISHGKNSWSDDHHRMLAGELSISRGLLARREHEIREGLAPFDFGPGDVIVSGSNGEAFRIAPGSTPIKTSI